MAAKSICIITKSDEGRGAFGIRADNDENVFFPFSVAETLELEEFEEVEAVMIKNDRLIPPWKAIRVRRLDERDSDQRSG